MTQLTRRTMMLRSAALGCSLAASPFVTPISLASAPWDNRLVVIILRGGMDGLDVVRPVGDPAFAALRQSGDGEMLDGFYELHPGLAPLMPLWRKGHLSFVQATSTPYRDKRSHFDGQDHLEAGFSTPDLGPVRDGWLNRMLASQPGLSSDVAFSIGGGEMLVLRGEAEISNWSPEVDLLMSPQALLLAEQIVQGDPLFQSTFEEAVQIADEDGDAILADMSMMEEGMMGGVIEKRKKGQRPEAALAKFAAKRLREETRIAAFSINGWDTHRSQNRLMQRNLAKLSDAILMLRKELGEVWKKTTVVALTEFGRTVRLNGTQGSDHGTGGLMILAGGGLARGQVAGRWPGLDEASLYQRRDLLPTSDVRSHLAWAMRHSFGIDRATLENTVFPGLNLGDDIGLFA